MIVASLRGNLSVVKRLLDFKVTPDHAGHDGRRAILAAVAGDKSEVVKLLASRGASLSKNIVTSNGMTLLTFAASQGNTDTVEILVSLKVDVNEVDANGETALIVAVRRRELAVVKLLITLRANVEYETPNQQLTALILAASNEHDEMVSALVEGRANLEHAQPNGRTPLFYAISKGNLYTLRLLINLKANVNHTLRNGKTSLEKALKYENMTIARELVFAGADPARALVHEAYVAAPLYPMIDAYQEIVAQQGLLPLTEMLDYVSVLPSNDGFQPESVYTSLCQMVQGGSRKRKP
jgi:ankyrin repeat protein